MSFPRHGSHLSTCVAFPRQGSHSEHVHQSLVLCVISRAFRKFRLYIDSGRAVLYDNYQGICNFVMKGHIRMSVLYVVLHLLATYFCAVCDLYAFLRLFETFTKGKFVRSELVHVLYVFYRVDLNSASMKH